MQNQLFSTSCLFGMMTEGGKVNWSGRHGSNELLNTVRGNLTYGELHFQLDDS
jgi:hypothetical protein